ncbi:Glutamine transport system permease protein glnP [Acholeplasma oculi]|uniref:Amino acid ABC transporter, permease protein n=1 Tax=Acholeplasma oculi TaxID=35623 RepID=A0A061AC85_9MOLU|nr:amino acid ABC transporter permease [Acholeplasma oculi]CDR31490.1 Amino acid ABC transporter, permease protein [Acholeplasma oculi]SKC49329.1 amino acid ABC transporter membrane protein, PAAT family (TC 3.A.1.3.-) [Acholeplasma oculi]SUT92236.1 Glutamine transport system permease protein glnP [Acholeplasma oculi]
MDFSFLLEFYYWEIFLKGLSMTLLLAVMAVVLGTLLGFIPAFMRIGKNKVLNFVATAYVELIRGTPLLVQVLLIYSFVKIPTMVFIGIELSSFIPGMLALLINSSAYVSEVIRGGILSVDKGQREAGLSLGLSEQKTLRLIILPQAIKNIIPQLGNEFVTIIKETSIFMYLGIAELMYSAQIIRSQTYQVKEAYIVVAVLYFALTFPTSRLMSYFEKRLKRSDEK